MQICICRVYLHVFYVALADVEKNIGENEFGCVDEFLQK